MAEHFFDIPASFAEREKAGAAIVSIPFEKTVSYGGGTARGPAAIFEASCQVEYFDEVLQREPYRAGIFSEAIPDSAEVSALSPEAMIERFSGIVGGHLDEGRFPVVLGGEHTVTLAPFDAAVRRHPDLHVLHLDAHADLRDTYEDDPFSHACVARRMVEKAPIVQIGIRSYDKEQADALKDLPVHMLHAHEIRAGRDMAAFADEHLGETVYLTIDLDAFDPSIMPATGTPEPGGLLWNEVDALLAWLFAHRRVVAMDVVELAPIDGLRAPDFLAARLVYRCIGRRAARK
ncbi:MAG: agmatinase [Candidatus Lernaella stagnicola]|nr:agmatinase [Candidatus Lernaella stagnicola]